MTRTPDEIHDELLATRCRRGDPAAWDQLVERYGGRLYYYLRRLVDDDEQAAQLLQEVWLHALRGLGALRHAGRLAPWLYAIARRAAMTHFRRRYAEGPAAGEPLDGVTDDGPDEALRVDDAELVHYGLSRIGLAEREVLTLFYLEDLSVAEISEVLAVPPGTVKSRLWRARRDLRRALEREAGAAAGEE